MSLFMSLALALGLAMDAFAVSIAAGIVIPRITLRTRLRLAFHLGLFQFLMPVVGWAAGLTVREHIEAYDHWIAFTLLAFVGGKMVIDAFGHEDSERDDPTRGWKLVVVSVATSIDALAVGISLGVLHSEGIVYPGIVIGIVAAAFTAAGLHLGKRLGAVFGKRMEVVGGLVLVAIGVKILLDHLRG